MVSGKVSENANHEISEQFHTLYCYKFAYINKSFKFEFCGSLKSLIFT